jgi:simple sugar transport system permease protein
VTGAAQVASAVRLVAAPAFAFAGALTLTALVLLIFGANPVEVFSAVFSDAFASWYGFSETLVKATPIMLCALAVAVPAWAGLTNVGAEGQLYIGATCAAGIALYGPALPAFALLPLMIVAAFAGGAVWAAAAAFLRAKFSTSEVMVTLVGNFLGVLFVQYLVYGPWRDPSSRGWPQTAEFSDAATLPHLGFERVHLGLVIAVVAAIILFALRRRTIWGQQLRVIEANKDVASYSGIRVGRYLFWSLVIGGGLAALAGMAEASAIQGRLRAELSPGYGYTGILVSWLARHNPIAIVFVALLIGGLWAGGDGIQITMGLPAATIGIAIGLMLFLLLVGDVLLDRVGDRR